MLPTPSLCAAVELPILTYFLLSVQKCKLLTHAYSTEHCGRKIAPFFVHTAFYFDNFSNTDN